MAAHVCPWWAVPFTIDPPIRRWIHDPRQIVGPYVQPGMTVLDVGCGVGWFTIPMSKMVGDAGRIIAADLQPQMLRMLERRAKKKDAAANIELHQCEPNRLGIDATVDFALIFAMLHEVPDRIRMLTEVFSCLKSNGKLLLAEPPIHVSRKTFDAETADAEKVGFRIVERPHVRWSHAVLLKKD